MAGEVLYFLHRRIRAVLLVAAAVLIAGLVRAVA